MARRKPNTLWIIIAFILIGVLLASWPASPVQAGPELPPREHPPSRQEGDDTGGNDESGPNGAYIELHVQPARDGLWTVVLWQDEVENWHEVEGWWGEIGPDGHRRWWVAPNDFGTGPFQWAIKEAANGPALAASQSFFLPGQANEVVQLEVSIAQNHKVLTKLTLLERSLINVQTFSMAPMSSAALIIENSIVRPSEQKIPIGKI